MKEGERRRDRQKMMRAFEMGGREGGKKEG